VSLMYLIHGPGGYWRNVDWSGKHVPGAALRSSRKGRQNATI